MRCPMCQTILAGPRQYFRHHCGKRKVWQDEAEARKAIKRDPISVVVSALCEAYSEPIAEEDCEVAMVRQRLAEQLVEQMVEEEHGPLQARREDEVLIANQRPQCRSSSSQGEAELTGTP